MLPKKLSNGIGSLNAGVDRFNLSIEMEIDKNGKVIYSDIFKGIIISQEDDPTLLVNGVPICKVRIEFTDDCVIKEKEFQTYSIDYNRYKVGKRVKVYKYGNEYYWDNKDVKEDYVVWL